MPDPFEVHQIIMHRAVSGVIDQIVDHQRLSAALDQRIALDIMRPDVAVKDDARRIVVDQRPLAMLALRMARVGEALGGEIVRKTDVVARPLTPFRKDRKSVASGKSVSVRVDLGGRRRIKKKTNNRISVRNEKE